LLIGLFKWMGWAAEHVALALSSTLAAFVNAGMLYWQLHRQGIYQFGAHWQRLALCYGVANAAMVAALWVGLQWYSAAEDQWLRAVGLLLLCAWGGAVYAGALLATGFRPRELRHR
jgi:putative peptidoglycan lipid II flippase